MNTRKSKVLFVGGPMDGSVLRLDEIHMQYVFTEGEVSFVYAITSITDENGCVWRVAKPREEDDSFIMRELLGWYNGGYDEIEPACKGAQ